MEETIEAATERANGIYQTQKRVLVTEAGGPRDALAMLEVWDADTMHLVVVNRPELAASCELARAGQFSEGKPIVRVVYSSDAVRREFNEAGPASADGQEVLVSVGLDAEGNFASVVTPYHYDGEGFIVWEVSETHQLLDSTVIADLRRAFDVPQWIDPGEGS